MKHLILILSLLVMGTACSSIPVIPDTTPKALSEYKPPTWVLKGGGAYTDSQGKSFYGVGSATGIKNYSLQRMVADDRARGDLAKVFDFYINSLTKDYQSHTTVGNFTTSNEEQNSENALKIVVAQTLRGVVIVDHFEIPQRREFLSLARLSFDTFKKNVVKTEAFKSLPKQTREDIKARADKLHKEMQIESDKILNNPSLFIE